MPYIGQILWWRDSKRNTEGSVTVIRVEKDSFTVLYEGKEQTRPNSIIGQKLFLQPLNLKNEETTHSCSNCRLRRNGNCTSLLDNVCEDFLAIPSISKEEKDAWPKYGDVSALRQNDYSRFRDN